MDDVAAITKKTLFVHGQVSGDLFHPSFIGIWCDAGDLDLTALKMDKEQHIISDQSAQRQHLYREKVSPRKDRHVRADEVGPSCRTLTRRRGRDTIALQNIANCLIR